jgi:hypothetical protein
MPVTPCHGSFVEQKPEQVDHAVNLPCPMVVVGFMEGRVSQGRNMAGTVMVSILKKLLRGGEKSKLY